MLVPLQGAASVGAAAERCCCACGAAAVRLGAWMLVPLQGSAGCRWCGVLVAGAAAGVPLPCARGSMRVSECVRACVCVSE